MPDEVEHAEYYLNCHEKNDGDFHSLVNIVSSLDFVVFLFKP